MYEDWMSVKDAAEQLGIAERTVIKYIHDGQLEAQKEGREWRINPTLAAPPQTKAYQSNAKSDDDHVYKMLKHTISMLEENTTVLKEQVQEKDNQIQNLQMLLALEKKEKIALTDEKKALTVELENEKRPWWKKLFGQKMIPTYQQAAD